MTPPGSRAKSGLGLAAALVGLEALAYAVVLPHLAIVVGQERPWWMVGVIFASYSMAQFSAIGSIGRAAERFGVLPVVAGCLIGTAVGLIMTAVSTNYWVLLVARLIDGASAGTVVVITATSLSWFPRARWTAVLGGIGAVRGAAAIVGLSATALVGIAFDDPMRGLSTAAWSGTVLVVIALAVTPLLRPPQGVWSVPTRVPAMRRPARQAFLTHVAAQGALAGLVLLAPAAASAVVSVEAGFAAPVAAIVGLAVGQVFFAASVDRNARLRRSMLGVLLVGVVAISYSPAVLVGFATVGVAVGSHTPRAQAALIAWRVEDGESDLGANALAGRGAVIGQIAGPIVAYVALTWSSILAAIAVAAFGLVGSCSRRPA